MIWGFLLFLAGLVFLAANFGYLNNVDVQKVWHFWPLLLVLVGIDLLFRRFKFGWVITLLALVLTGVFIYDVAFSHKPVLNVNTTGGQVKNSQFSADFSESIKRLTLRTQVGAVKFNLKGTGDKLVSGSLSSNLSQAILSVNQINDRADAFLKTETQGTVWIGGLKNDLSVAVSNKVPVDFNLESGAATMDIDLTDIILSSLRIKTGASTVKLKVGQNLSNDVNDMEVDAGASDIDILLPVGMGARIKTETGLADRSFKDFERKGDYFVNADYDKAPKKLNITIKAGASSILVKTY